jgi:hypothetical protein
MVGSCVPKLPLNATICGGSLGLCTPTSQRSPLEPLLELDEELEELLLEDELLELEELLLEDEELEELPPQAAASVKVPELCTVKESIFTRPALLVASSRILLIPAFRSANTAVELAQVVNAPVAGISMPARTSTPLISNRAGRLPEVFA